jgi:hypothetical protein
MGLHRVPTTARDCYGILDRHAARGYRHRAFIAAPAGNKFDPGPNLRSVRGLAQRDSPMVSRSSFRQGTLDS